MGQEFGGTIPSTERLLSKANIRKDLHLLARHATRSSLALRTLVPSIPFCVHLESQQILLPHHLVTLFTTQAAVVHDLKQNSSLVPCHLAHLFHPSSICPSAPADKLYSSLCLPPPLQPSVGWGSTAHCSADLRPCRILRQSRCPTG